MTSQSAPFPGPDNEVSCKQNGFVVSNDNNNSSATCILDPSSRLAISIALPDADAVIQWNCKASTVFGEVIKQVCAEYGLDASLHVLVVDNEEDDAVHVEGSECRPSNLVGLSKRRQFLLLPRTQLVKDPYSYKAMREKKASVTTVEMTNRVLVHLPQHKRVVIRISLKESVKSVFDQVCSEKQLYPPDFVVCHPDTREPLDMNKSLADYNIMEMLIEKITGPCESQTLPRRSGAGARAMQPSRTKAKSASKATGANVFNDDISRRHMSYHGSSVSLAVDGVHGERRMKKPSKINAFLTFLKIKKKKKPKKDDVDGSIENLSASPISSPTRGRPTLLSGGRPVSAFIPPESLPAQRPTKKRRAPAPPPKAGRLSGEEEEGRLKAQAAVPGLSQSVPALPSLVPVQVDIAVDETSQPLPEDDKRRRRRAAPRPPTPPHDVEDAHRAPPNFVAPPPPEEPPPADIPITLKPYHEDKAVDAAGVSELAMDLTGSSTNVQTTRPPNHKLSINDNRRKSRLKEGLGLGTEINALNGLTNSPGVNVGNISSGRDRNGKELSVAPVLHVDKPTIRPELGVVKPTVNDNVKLSLEAKLDTDIASCRPQVMDNKAVKLDADTNRPLSDIQLKNDALSVEPELDVNAASPPITMALRGDASFDHELDANKLPSPKIGMKLSGDACLESESDFIKPPSPHVDMKLNGRSSLETDLGVSEPSSPQIMKNLNAGLSLEPELGSEPSHRRIKSTQRSPHIDANLNAGLALEPELDVSEPSSPQIETKLNGDLSFEPHLCKDESMSPRFQDDIIKSPGEPLECSLGEGLEMDASKDIDLDVKRKIHVGGLSFGVDEDSSSSESENEVKEEDNLVDRKVAVILMSSESRVFEDFNGSNFEEKCVADGEKDELNELICQETAATLVNSVLASAVEEYAAWSASADKVAETRLEDGDKVKMEGKSAAIKTYVVKDEDRMTEKEKIDDEEDRKNHLSGFLGDHHFDIEMEKILSEDQTVHSDTDNVFDERTSDECPEEGFHQEKNQKSDFCALHQEEREEVFFAPPEDIHPQLLQFNTSREGGELSPFSHTIGENDVSSDHLHKEDSSSELDIQVSSEDHHKPRDSTVALVMDRDLGSHDVEGSAAVKGSLPADNDVKCSAAVKESLPTDQAVHGEQEDNVFDTRPSDVVRKTENARSRCHELAFDPEAAEEDDQMEVKLVTPVCSPVKPEEATMSSHMSSSTHTLHTDNELSLSDTSSLAYHSGSPAWSAGSGGPRSIFLKAMEQSGSANPVIESLEQQVELWKDQLVLNRKRLEDSESGGSHGQENLMQEQIKLQQALVAQMERNISSLRARSSSEVTSSSSACPSTRSVASDKPSNVAPAHVAPAHVAPKITRQRDQHRDDAKPIFDSKVDLPQSSARAARMAARAGRRSESVKSDEM